jgi:hypothetical protein
VRYKTFGRRTGLRVSEYILGTANFGSTEADWGAILDAFAAVVGPRTLDQLQQYLASLELVLTEDQCRRLDDVSAVRLGVPHESVAGALRGGLDGDRSQLDETPSRWSEWLAGQGEEDGRALVRAAGGPDPAAVLGHDPLRQG